MNRSMVSWFLVGLCVGAAALSAGCSTVIPEESKTRELIREEDKPRAGEPSTEPYISLRSGDRDVKTIPLRANNLPLRQALELAVPVYRQFIPMDGNVRLSTPVTLSVESMPVAEFFDFLSTITGYEYKANGGNVYVSAYTSKEWLLPALASSKKAKARVAGGSAGQSSGGGSSGGSSGGSGGGSGGGASGGRELSSEFNYEVDEWKSTIEAARAILGVSGVTPGSALPPSASQALSVDSAGSSSIITQPVNSGGAVSVTAENGAELYEQRSLGLIRATGPVPKIRKLDAWLSSLSYRSTQQVRLETNIIEVTLNDSKAAGVNWQLVMDQLTAVTRGDRIGVVLGAMLDPAAIVDAGQVTVGVSGQYDDSTLSTLFTLLGRYGTAELKNQPQITTTAGRTAYIGSGQEFGYVASIEQQLTTGVASTTAKTERILIGVEVAVTPRILDGGRIMLDIVPVVTTFQGFDTFNISGNQFSQPRITLNQLATQVVARDGEIIQLGGLITSRLTENIKSLPLEDRRALGLLRNLFSSDENVLERRELMLLVKPTLVNS